MDPLYEVSWHLSDVLKEAQRAFLKIEPEFLDFSTKTVGKLIIESRGRVEIELNPQNVKQIAGLLQATIFDKEQVPLLLCYNIKSLFSYFRFYLKKEVIPTTPIVDLHVIESFLNLNKKCPKNLIEAINRSEAVSKYKRWTTVYRKIHLPLILKVIPSVESTPLLDKTDKSPKYLYYEIEGQVNGRLNCLKKFKKGYLPHNLSMEQKSNLKPRGDGYIFFSADFRHCEVTVLQWLSKDEVLKAIIDSGEDVYAEIFRIITGDECDTVNKRNMSKRMFLPVMYGLGDKGLSKNLSIPETTAREIINRINKKFVTATKWMQKQQDVAKSKNVTIDYFGRPRKYQEGESYKARNFAVQAPAAVVCAEKAIALYKELNEMDARLCYTVHDGYVMICHMSHKEDMVNIVRNTLEAESAMCPGLQMKVEICYGDSLDQMSVI